MQILDTSDGCTDFPNQYKLITSYFPFNVKALPPLGLPLNLQTYPQYCSGRWREDADIGASALDHELQLLVKRAFCHAKQILIQISNLPIPDVLSKYTLIRGYTYQLQGAMNEYEEKTLFDEHFIHKQIQYQFQAGEQKPTFIGQINLGAIKQDKAASAYFKYIERGCPLVVNFMEAYEEIGCNDYFNGREKCRDIVERFKTLAEMGEVCVHKQINTVIVKNIPIHMQSKWEEEKICVRNIYREEINNILEKYPINIQFNILRYAREKYCLVEICQYAVKYSQKIIIDYSIQYKTDLQMNAGIGLSEYQCKDNSIIHKFLDARLFQKLTIENKIRLFFWKKKQIVQKVIILWKCDNCQKEQNQDGQSFTKFNKKFCSIKCVKSYKFEQK